MSDSPERVGPDPSVWAELPTVAEPVYRIDERPARWWETALYGWQHTLVDVSPFVLPLAVASALGMTPAETAALVNFSLFGMGLATLVQTTIGNRLPLIQGPSATLAGTLAPVAGQLGAAAMWGGVFVGALVEMTVGASRVLGTLRRLFPPAVSGVVVVTIGLTLAQVAVRLTVGDGRPLNFVFAALVIGVIALLQLRGATLLGGIPARGAIFFAVVAVGIGVGGALGEVDWRLVAARPWVAVPGLFPFGGPGFGWAFVPAAVLAILAGYFGSIVESLGDYAAVCVAAGERYTVRHMNRGIFAEGLGCAVAAVFGGLPVTSYTQNIGVIAATRVASRFVVQVAAGLLLLYGLSPKLGAVLVAMPRSAVGGVFVVVCGVIAVSGMRLLRAAPDHPRTHLVVGATLVLALGIPPYARLVLGETWLESLPPLAALVLTNPVVLAVLLGVGLNAGLELMSAQARGQRSAN